MIPSYLTPLANHLWQSTLFAIAVAGLAVAFRKNRAAVRHSLWLAASLKFLIPFSLFVGLGGQFHGRLSSPASTLHMPVVFEEFNEPFVAQSLPTAPIAVPQAKPDRLPIALVSLWLVGLGVCVLGWVNQWRRVRRLIRAASPLDLGLAIPVVSSHERIEPGVFGILRPVLILPNGISEQLSPMQFQTIIAHELCHVRRRDNLISTVHMLVESMFWFHPLVWWIETRLLEEQEAACDEAVLGSGVDPETYAEGILKVCELYIQTTVGCVSGVTGANLKKRLGRIVLNLRPLKLTNQKRWLLAISGMAAISAPVLLGAIRIAPGLGKMPAVLAQLSTLAPPPQPFDAATLKVNKSGAQAWELTVPSHGYIRGTNVSLMYVLQVAYHIQTPQIIGAPDWISSTNVDIEAKGPPTANGQEVYGMVRLLLADRLKLATHVEKRELPVYALTVAKGGPKVGNPANGPCKEALLKGEPCGDVNYMASGLVGWNMTSSVLANNLGRVLRDRPVVDQTGITSRFDLRLEWEIRPGDSPMSRPEESAGPSESVSTRLDSIRAALQDQAGGGL